MPLDLRRAGAVVLVAGFGEVVVMTKAVLQSRLTNGNVVGEVIVEGVPDAHLVGVFREALADQILENQGGGQGRTAEQLGDLADEDLPAEIRFDVILHRPRPAVVAASAADDRLLLLGAAARQQYSEHFERQRILHESAVFVKGILLDRQQLLHQPADLAPLLRTFLQNVAVTFSRFEKRLHKNPRKVNAEKFGAALSISRTSVRNAQSDTARLRPKARAPCED